MVHLTQASSLPGKDHPWYTLHSRLGEPPSQYGSFGEETNPRLSSPLTTH